MIPLSISFCGGCISLAGAGCKLQPCCKDTASHAASCKFRPVFCSLTEKVDSPFNLEVFAFELGSRRGLVLVSVLHLISDVMYRQHLLCSESPLHNEAFLLRRNPTARKYLL